MIPCPTDAWPILHPVQDCWGGDEFLFDPSDWDNHRIYTANPVANKEAYDDLDRAFMDVWFACAHGEREREDPELIELANLLGLPPTPHPDRRPIKVAPEPVDPLRIWEMFENGVPDGTPLALDRVLGPYADRTLDRRLHRIAVEAFAFSPTADFGLPPMKRWAGDVSRPTPKIRAGMRAIAHAPAMLWEVLDTGECEALLPLSEPYLPTGPVRGVAEQLPDARGTELVARLYPDADGNWNISGGLWVHAPPLDALLERLELEHLRLSRHERRLTWEDLLRYRAELLYRLCAIHTDLCEG